MSIQHDLAAVVSING
jgi:hypothetical protein